MTPFSDLFLGARVNNIYTSRNSNIASPVFVNMTIQLGESQETLRTGVKQDLQKHLMGVIQRRSNNIGASALWVDSPNGVVSQIHGKYFHPNMATHSNIKCNNASFTIYRRRWMQQSRTKRLPFGRKMHQCFRIVSLHMSWGISWSLGG